MANVTLDPTNIRTDLVTRLKAASTVAGQRVFDSRRIDVDTDELPAIVVTTLGHKDEKDGQNVLLFKRTERIQVTGIVTGTTDEALASAVDAVEDDILVALIEDDEWNASFEAIGDFQSDKSLDLSSKKRVGGVGIQFAVQYHVQYTPDLTGMDLHEVAVTTEATDPEVEVSERVIDIEQET